MFAKTAVKDPGGSPLFDALAKATGARPKWNFHKYLIARDGMSAASFPSKVEPESPEFVGKLEELLR
jgi:glutathione peroxidase